MLRKGFLCFTGTVFDENGKLADVQLQYVVRGDDLLVTFSPRAEFDPELVEELFSKVAELCRVEYMAGQGGNVSKQKQKLVIKQEKLPF